MNRGLSSEQSPLPYNFTHNSNDAEEDYSAYQADFHHGNLQSNGTEVSPITSGSYTYPFHQFGLCDGSEYLSIQQSVPSTPNDQIQFYLQPPSNDLSLTHDQVLDSFFEGHRNGNDPRHLASIQTHYADGWGNTNVRAVQEGIADYLEAQGAFGSNPPRSSSATIADTSSSLSDDGSYSQYGVRDDYPRVISSSRGQVEGASQSHTVTQGQDAARQETYRRRQQKIQAKKERDRIRKESDRAADDRAYSRVCTLLAIKLKPKNTRSQRIQEGVESIDQDFEKMCELLEISMTPRKTLAHRILKGVEAMAERQKLDRDLRRRVEEREAEIALLRLKSFQGSTEVDTGSCPPINTYTALGGSDTGATLHSWP